LAAKRRSLDRTQTVVPTMCLRHRTRRPTPESGQHNGKCLTLAVLFACFYLIVGVYYYNFKGVCKCHRPCLLSECSLYHFLYLCCFFIICRVLVDFFNRLHVFGSSTTEEVLSLCLVLNGLGLVVVDNSRSNRE